MTDEIHPILNKTGSSIIRKGIKFNEFNVQ